MLLDNVNFSKDLLSAPPSKKSQENPTYHEQAERHLRDTERHTPGVCEHNAALNIIFIKRERGGFIH